jgi:hypothetical protein
MFWILLFFIARLYGITNPPLEAASNWRQCDGLMIARNFYEHNPNIFYPTMDIAGDKTGITGSEFPLFNYLIYVVSLLFGYSSWYGRIINLIISSLGTFYFYRLIAKYFNPQAAFYSTILLLVSLWFGYARITIPDTFAASLCLISIYYGLLFMESGGALKFFIFFLLALCGCLVKISAAVLLTIFAIPFFSKSPPINRKIWFALAAGFILIAVYAWYFYWVPYLNTISGFPPHYFMGQKLSDGIEQLKANWERALYHFYYTPLKYTGFIVFLFCLFLTVKNKHWLTLLAFTLPFCSFLYIILVAGHNFTVNSYYPLMLVPPMAFIAGYGLTFLKNEKWVYLILLIVGIEGIANQIHTYSIRYPFSAFASLEQILDSSGCKRNDLIAINTDDAHNPMPMYFAHRKGWNIPSNENLKDPNQIAFLKEHGCKYIVVMDVIFGSSVELPLPKVYSSKEFIVYKL